MAFSCQVLMPVIAAILPGWTGPAALPKRGGSQVGQESNLSACGAVNTGCGPALHRPHSSGSPGSMFTSSFVPGAFPCCIHDLLGD